MGALTIIGELGLEAIQRYYSFYHGIVQNDQDPYNGHRLQIIVPEIQQGLIVWASPLRDIAGDHLYLKYPTPNIGDEVFVVFRMGNIQSPFWLPFSHHHISELIPEELRDVDCFGLITYGDNRIWINDKTGELHISTKGIIHIDSETNIIINQGKNAGMVKINELTDKLNKLVSEIETLRSTFNTHTHSGVQSGPGTTGIPISPDNQAITQFNKDDYENTKITH